jgi:hypothetical protein
MALPEPEVDRRHGSPIIEELRSGGDEFQITRVLAAVCASAPEISRAFVTSLLRAAATSPEIGHRARDLRVPSVISCTREHGLARVGRRAIARQKKTLGTPDLTFTADESDFHLICELKLNAPYRRDQINDYLQRQGAFVISVVRKPRGMRSEVSEHERWLGEIAWSAIKEDLHRLPLAEHDRAIWLDLLDVMERDGDFEPTQPKRATEEDRAVAEGVASIVLAKLQSAVRERPGGDAYAEGLRIGRVRLGRRDARAPIEDARKEVLFDLFVRNARLRTPSIGVDWYPRGGRRAEREERDMRERLEAGYRFRRRTGRGGYFHFREGLNSKRDGLVDAAGETAWRAVHGVVSLGLLDGDIRDAAGS